MTERTEFLETDQFLVKRLVIPFDLTAATWIVWPAEDQFNTVFLSFCIESFSDKLFPIIDLDFAWVFSITECPLQGVDS